MQDLGERSSREFSMQSVYLSVYTRIALKYQISVIFDCSGVSAEDLLRFEAEFLSRFCQAQSLDPEKVKSVLYFFNLPPVLRKSKWRGRSNPKPSFSTRKNSKSKCKRVLKTPTRSANAWPRA